ncbi:hypothetical protein [Bradyrhizobium sp. LMG 9283]|uniref:hypothetical protein n=1 Tax=Bradyrhizobium sp. LMG 9283 TaxID=592064 RepID=UPI00388CEDDC
MRADHPSPASLPGVGSAKCQGAVWLLMWEIRTINFRLDKLRQFRKPSTSDSRIVEMSLTRKTYEHLASVAAQEEALDQFVFGDLAIRELTDFAEKLTALKHRLEKARLIAARES